MILPYKKQGKGKVLMLPIDQIQPCPFQARTQFEEEELAGLAMSILENGLLQPVTVRKRGQKYELIAGERRLRACRMARLSQVPAILCDYQDEQTAALSLLENLQRQDLNAFDQAKGIKEMIALWGCTQEEAARRLGMAQPTLNNKLRLLALTPEEQAYCLEQNLTERHARAILRLPEGPQRKRALEQFAQQGLNARQADGLVERMLTQPPQRRKRIPMVRDVRIFVNTINKAVQLMVEAGVPAKAEKKEEEGYLEYTVRIPVEAAKVKEYSQTAAP